MKPLLCCSNLFIRSRHCSELNLTMYIVIFCHLSYFKLNSLLYITKCFDSRSTMQQRHRQRCCVVRDRKLKGLRFGFTVVVPTVVVPTRLPASISDVSYQYDDNDNTYQNTRTDPPDYYDHDGNAYVRLASNTKGLYYYYDDTDDGTNDDNKNYQNDDDNDEIELEEVDEVATTAVSATTSTATSGTVTITTTTTISTVMAGTDRTQSDTTLHYHTAHHLHHRYHLGSNSTTTAFEQQFHLGNTRRFSYDELLKVEILMKQFLTSQFVTQSNIICPNSISVTSYNLDDEDTNTTVSFGCTTTTCGTDTVVRTINATILSPNCTVTQQQLVQDDENDDDADADVNKNHTRSHHHHTSTTATPITHNGNRNGKMNVLRYVLRFDICCSRIYILTQHAMLSSAISNSQ